jgi:hypothetical protein
MSGDHPTTKSLVNAGLRPLLGILEQGVDVTTQTEKYWIKKMLADGHPLENRDGVLNYQEKENFSFTDEEMTYILSLPKIEQYELIIKRILKELPRDPSTPIVVRIKNLCETVLK